MGGLYGLHWHWPLWLTLAYMAHTLASTAYKLAFMACKASLMLDVSHSCLFA